jgi:hypothetical protein
MIQPLPEQDVDEYAAIIPALEQLIPSPGSADPLPGKVGSDYIDPCNRDFHSLGSLLAMQVSRSPTGPFMFAFMQPPPPPPPPPESVCIHVEVCRRPLLGCYHGKFNSVLATSSFLSLNLYFHTYCRSSRGYCSYLVIFSLF